MKTPNTTDPDLTWVLAGTIIAGFSPLQTYRNGAVAIRGARVEWVGPAPSGVGSASGNVIDLGDTHVLPGLVDSHAHLAFDASPDPIQALLNRTDAELDEAIQAAAQAFLATGVTTVRDLGSPGTSVLEYRDSVASGSILGPAVVASGRPITRRAGHLWQLGVEVEHDNARAGMDSLVADGVDVCKVMVTGGRMTPGTSPADVEFPTRLFKHVVALAHERGLRVAAHALSTAGIEAAIAARVDTIEHCTFIDDFDRAHEDRDVGRIARRIADAGIAVCPTLIRNSGTNHPISFEQRAGWVRMMHECGVQIIAGHDTGIPGVPPTSFIECLGSLAGAGLTPCEVLHAATAAPAMAMGTAADVGELRAGHRADLIAVEGNPLEDVSLLRHLRFVMARGRVVGRLDPEDDAPDCLDLIPES